MATSFGPLLALLLCGLCSCAAANLGNESSPSSKMDFAWLAELAAPQSAALAEAAKLSSRADALAGGLSAQLGPVDVVVSGGGNFDAYYMGAAMVLSRLQARGLLSQQRWAGVSAGGMMPFELALKGENSTLAQHLDYGLLQQQNPLRFDPGGLRSGERQDHQWRLMADWQARAYPQLSRLDGRVFLGTSCLKPLPTLVLISNYTSPAQAASAFMSTGTVYEWYQGMACSDGGATSGKRMTPLFQDRLRPQLVVSILPSDHTDQPSHLLFKYNMTEWSQLVEQGQDDAAKFFSCGPTKPECSSKRISFCPTGKATKDNICQP